jgi:hypothetical protein
VLDQLPGAEAAPRLWRQSTREPAGVRPGWSSSGEIWWGSGRRSRACAPNGVAGRTAAVPACSSRCSPRRRRRCWGGRGSTPVLQQCRRVRRPLLLLTLDQQPQVHRGRRAACGRQVRPQPPHVRQHLTLGVGGAASPHPPVAQRRARRVESGPRSRPSPHGRRDGCRSGRSAPPAPRTTPRRRPARPPSPTPRPWGTPRPAALLRASWPTAGGRVGAPAGRPPTGAGPSRRARPASGRGAPTYTCTSAALPTSLV